jgi:hypothetical protein
MTQALYAHVNSKKNKNKNKKAWFETLPYECLPIGGPGHLLLESS